MPFRNPGATWYEHDERYADRNADPILKPNEKHLGVMNFLSGESGKVLDVGCGVGNFLALAHARGWECWGVDFDRDAIEAGKQTFGLEHLSVASLEDFHTSHPDLHFELITFFDVFEHLDNHNEFLELVTKMLTPEGKIALSVPYRHGWRWFMQHDLPPRHLTRWDETSLKNVLSRHDFRIAYLKRLPASLYFITLKFRFNYGEWTSFGLVGKVKKRASVGTPLASSTVRTNLRVRLVQALAKIKDFVLFGLPAGCVWLALLPTRKRYTDFYIVAEPK